MEPVMFVRIIFFARQKFFAIRKDRLDHCQWQCKGFIEYYKRFPVPLIGGNLSSRAVRSNSVPGNSVFRGGGWKMNGTFVGEYIFSFVAAALKFFWEGIGGGAGGGTTSSTSLHWIPLPGKKSELFPARGTMVRLSANVLMVKIRRGNLAFPGPCPTSFESRSRKSLEENEEGAGKCRGEGESIFFASDVSPWVHF